MWYESANVALLTNTELEKKIDFVSVRLSIQINTDYHSILFIPLFLSIRRIRQCVRGQEEMHIAYNRSNIIEKSITE